MLSNTRGLTTCLTLILRTCVGVWGARRVCRCGCASGGRAGERRRGGAGAERPVRARERCCASSSRWECGGRAARSAMRAAGPHLLIVEEAKGHRAHAGGRDLLAVKAGLHGHGCGSPEARLAGDAVAQASATCMRLPRAPTAPQALGGVLGGCWARCKRANRAGGQALVAATGALRRAGRCLRPRSLLLHHHLPAAPVLQRGTAAHKMAWPRAAQHAGVWGAKRRGAATHSCLVTRSAASAQREQGAIAHSQNSPRVAHASSDAHGAPPLTCQQSRATGRERPSPCSGQRCHTLPCSVCAGVGGWAGAAESFGQLQRADHERPQGHIAANLHAHTPRAAHPPHTHTHAALTHTPWCE